MSVARLKEAVLAAHRQAATANDNLSSGIVKMLAATGVPFSQAVAGAVVSLGGAHGPIVQCRAFLYGPLDWEPRRLLVQTWLEAGRKVPGFGNSFFRGQLDPAWQEVSALITRDFAADHQILCEAMEEIEKHKGVMLYPNAAAYSTVLAERSNHPRGAELSIAMEARMPVWAQQYADAYREVLM